MLKTLTTNSLFMAFALAVIGVVVVWTAALGEWVVALSTAVAQLGIWITLAGLLPVASLWVTLKRQPFQDQPTELSRAHWSVQLKG